MTPIASQEIPDSRRCRRLRSQGPGPFAPPTADPAGLRPRRACAGDRGADGRVLRRPARQPGRSGARARGDIVVVDRGELDRSWDGTVIRVDPETGAQTLLTPPRLGGFRGSVDNHEPCFDFPGGVAVCLRCPIGVSVAPRGL